MISIEQGHFQRETMTPSLLNELKIEIRSLLISSPSGLREDELSRDYARFNSQRALPYHLFGYSTLTDFLNSLNDVLYRSTDGLIYPVVDQSTEHIFKFVQQQRSKKKKKKKNGKQTSIKPSVGRKRAMPTVKASSSPQHIHIAVDARKSLPLMKQMRIITESKARKEEPSFARLKSTMNNPSPKFERVVVTNDFLRNLLMHFRQQRC